MGEKNDKKQVKTNRRFIDTFVAKVRPAPESTRPSKQVKQNKNNSKEGR